MSRVRKDRGTVFGTSSMSSRNRPVSGGNPYQSASNVASNFGTSLSKSPVYMGRKKSMRR
jgi:hypothetical protein